MEQINTYIQQARQQGQTDEQIRQALVSSGWNSVQVNSALGESPASTVVSNANQTTDSSVTVIGNTQVLNTDTQQSTSIKGRSKLPLLIVGLVALAVIIAGGVFALYGHKTSYQTVTQQFITAVQNKDKATADSLESPAMKTFGQKNVGTPSFYDACQQAGQLCMPLFTSSFLDKATKTYKDYTASNGTKGKGVVYSLKQSLNGTQAGGQGCSSNSTNTLTIDVVPKGNSWLIDSANPSINASANLCLAPGGTSSAGN